MRELQVTHSDLKLTIKRMYSLLRRTVSNNYKLNLRTAFYQDLGIVGQDWDSFMEEYEKEFNCRLSGLIYKDYFVEVGTDKDVILIPLRLLFSPLFLLPDRYNKGIKKLLFPMDESKGRLTIGDLVLSAIEKQFIKREQTKIKIKYAR